MSRVLVSGATGFVGSRLVARIAARESVTILHPIGRAGVPHELWADADVEVVRFGSPAEVPSIVADLAPDRVFHLATRYQRSHENSDIEPLIAANITLGTSLLEGARAAGSRFVSTASFLQYANGVPDPRTLYAATKQAFSDVLRYYRSDGLDAREVILFDTYGEGDPRDKLVTALLAAARDGVELTLGTPQQHLDLLHADDVSDGLLAAADEPEGGIRQLRATSFVSIATLVETVSRVSGRVLEVRYRDSAPDTRLETVGQWATPAGWAPRVTLDEGIGRAWEAASHDLR
jgi:nucleoside-diphosphate-sugar epimerase